MPSLSRGFVIAILFTTALAYSKKKPEMPDVTVTKQDNGTSVKLGIHGILRIELPENTSTGFGWQMDGLNGAVLTLKETTYNAEKKAPGAGGIRIYEIRAVAVGHQIVSLALKRAWERDSDPAERFSVTVDVVPTK